MAQTLVLSPYAPYPIVFVGLHRDTGLCDFKTQKTSVPRCWPLESRRVQFAGLPQQSAPTNPGNFLIFNISTSFPYPPLEPITEGYYPSTGNRAAPEA